MQEHDQNPSREPEAEGDALPTDDSRQPLTDEQEAPREGEDLRSIFSSFRDELMGEFKRVQGQARAAETAVSELVPRLDILFAAMEQRQAADPFAELGEIDDPVLAAIVQQQRQTAQVLQGFQRDRQQQQQRAQVTEARNYAVGELKRIANLAGVDFADLEAAVSELPDAQLWAQGVDLVAAAKEKQSKAPTKERRQAERQAGMYTERRRTGGTAAKSRESYTADDIKNMSPQEVADHKFTPEELEKILSRE